MDPAYFAASYELHNHLNDIVVRHPSSTCRFHTAEEHNQPLCQVPAPRSGHLLLSCPQRRSIILHGGLGVGPLDAMNDTWEYCPDEQRWIKLICHSATADASSQDSEDSVSSEDSCMPPRAFGQCGTLFGGGRFLFVHGGITPSNSTSSCAFQLDLEKRLWTRVRLSQPLQNMWGSVAQTLRIPRVDTINKGCCSESETQETAGSTPVRKRDTSRRKCHRDQVEVVVLFGGMQDDMAFNDTYFLYLSSPPGLDRDAYGENDERFVLKLPSLSKHTFPGRRRACSSVCNDMFLFVFGGRDNHSFYNDMWVLNAYTRQWVMIRGETPPRYMQEFFRWPFKTFAGERVMNFVENLLTVRRSRGLCCDITGAPHACRRFNSSACCRTGAVMVSRGTELFVVGGFTLTATGLIETHDDVHVYDYMRHTWRVVPVKVGLPLPPFPMGYFQTGVSAVPRNENEGPFEPPLEWKLVQNLRSTAPNGRTMAGMCADPIFPGLRFFMFGGRYGEDACGELYDVRISTLDSDYSQKGASPFCTPGLGVPVEYEHRRSLHAQTMEWLKAILVEHDVLTSATSLLRNRHENRRLARKEWLEDARKCGAATRVLELLPNPLQAYLKRPRPYTPFKKDQK
ncbi:Kelch motifGalactose oxidase central domain [Trypanosoma vivax]|uniref:Uncharacterized protein n=1 Tax=Trypanosoma vivax (strain Y486) TaxID=1055687 RepID=G0TVG7_TRYVY|nr:Kelch motifGalactose oxidase central domain [Trypanosoma vivax]CCC47933.1 conserved hypothetical protein [Trypanosoma vivax Y486]